MTASALTRPGERERFSVKFGQIDWGLVAVLCLIGGAGVAMLYSIAGGSWEPWAFKHLTRFAISLTIMLVLALVSLRVWFTLAYPLYGLTLVMLVGVEAIGAVAKGGQRWLEIGGFSLQPSEFMKVAIVLALARFYHGLPAKDANLSWKLLIPAGMILVPVGLIFVQPDLGTAILVALTGGAVMVLAGLSFRIMGALAVLGAAAAWPVYRFGLHDYQRERLVTMFSGKGADVSDAGYQVAQSKIAFGSGGLMGQGYGLGSQSQLNFIPEKHTDFIFATLAEEFGFVGCVSLLLLFAAAIFISLRIAAISHSHFGRLAAAGVTATFTVCVLINGAMVMGLAPVVGVPMPLLSYGGTVMISIMAGFGLVQSVRVHRYDEVGSGKGSLF